MRDCEQTAGQDVLSHGRSVREQYEVLVVHLRGALDLSQAPNWRLPGWSSAQLLAGAADDHISEQYLTLHEGGKAAVRTVDGEARANRTGHATASIGVYEGVQRAGRFARRRPHRRQVDHVLKGHDAAPFAQRPTAVTRLLAALAEVTSEGAVFVG